MARSLRLAIQVVFLSIALEIFWIACTASVHAHELGAGIPAVLLSATFSAFAVRKLPIIFRPAASDLAQIWQLPWSVMKDVVLVTEVLLARLVGRPAPSLFRSAPWRENSQTGEETARRTLATAYTTISPNMIVIGIDRAHGQIFFHQLRPDAVPRLLRRLGAGDGQ